MKYFTKMMINDLAENLNMGNIGFQTSDSIPWFFYVKLNTNIEGMKNIVDERLPVWKIENIERTSELLDEYLTYAKVFYEGDKDYFNLLTSQFDKKLIFDLVVNATNYDLENFDEYVEKKTRILKTKVNKGSFNFGEIELPFGKANVNAIIRKTPSKLEGPYKMIISLESELGKFTLPAITFGLEKNKAYVYAVQAKKEKEENELAKKLDRYFRKFNKDIDLDELEGKVSPNALASTVIFFEYLKKLGIKRVVAPVYMPVRYFSRLLKNEGLEDINNNERQKNEELIDRDQFSMTNRFSANLLRYSLHFAECSFGFNDMTDEINLEFSKSNKKSLGDNEIYIFQKQVNGLFEKENEDEEEMQ